MKKIAKFVAAILVACSILSIFSACGDKNNQTIDEKIKAAYIEQHQYYPYNFTVEDVSLSYYGDFNGTYVLMVYLYRYGYECIIGQSIVDGVKFIYSDSNELTAYSKGKFYSLTEAFAKGLLTHSDLLEVQRNYRADYEYLYRW